MRRLPFGLGIFLCAFLLWPALSWASTTILQNAATADGDGKNISTDDVGAVGMAVSIAGTATLTFEGSVDGGTTWGSLTCVKLAAVTFVSTTTASDQFQCSTAGLSHVRSRISGCSACTVTVTARTSSSAANIFFGSVALNGLLFGEDSSNSLIRTSGGAVRVVNITTATTNTTSAAVAVFSGGKTPRAKATAAAGFTATVSFYGDNDTTATLGEHICTLILDGTTENAKHCAQFTKDYSYIYAVTTAFTGSPTLIAEVAVGAVGNDYPQFLGSGIKTSDALIKTGPGFLQCITIAQNDAAPTAGTISVNDAVSAGTGTAIFTWVLTTAVFTPFQVCPQQQFATGLYFDFTTVADVNVSGSYR